MVLVLIDEQIPLRTMRKGVKRVDIPAQECEKEACFARGCETCRSPPVSISEPGNLFRNMRGTCAETSAGTGTSTLIIG